MHKTDLKVPAVTGHHIFHPLPFIFYQQADTVAILKRKHTPVIMSQLITQQCRTVECAQNANPDRCGGHNFVVELLVLLQTHGAVFGRHKYPPFQQPGKQPDNNGRDQIKNRPVEDLKFQFFID